MGSTSRGLAPTLAALLVLASLGALVACVGGEAAPAEPTPAPVGSPLAPDLAFAPIADLQIGTAPDGRRFLFFSGTIVNLGDGALLIGGTRDGNEWSLVQRIRYSGSGEEAVPLQFSMTFGGDGHDHWHIAEAAEYRLLPLDEHDGAPRFDSKVGFCFFDQAVYREDLIGGVTEPAHAPHECGHEDVKTLAMGLSVGWGDPYQWFLPGQSIDVTDVADGRYRLEASVDTLGRFQETDTTNNTTWVEFEIVTRALDGLPVIRVLDASGPY